MSETPLISIILPIYNIEKYLSKCMDSVLNQTYHNLEIIMIDDGSTDNCRQICDDLSKLDERIIVYHKTNGGLSDARNYGIKRAKGEYITCIDPDDFVDFDYVEYLWEILDKYSVKMSVCQHRVIYNNGSKKNHGKNGNEIVSTNRCIERLLYHDVIDTSACAKLYHKSLFDNVEYPKGKLFEDIGTTYALMMQCEKIAIGYEAKYNYIFHNNSIVNGIFRPSKFDLIEMTDKMANDVLKKYPELSSAVRRRQVYARFSTLNQMLRTNEYEKERHEIIGYLKNHRHEILFNHQAPNRDKVAMLLLSMNYKLYRFCWLKYQDYIMGEKYDS